MRVPVVFLRDTPIFDHRFGSSSGYTGEGIRPKFNHSAGTSTLIFSITNPNTAVAATHRIQVPETPAKPLTDAHGSKNEFPRLQPRGERLAFV